MGLLLNGEKTVVLTNEAQPPSHLWTRTGIKLHVKNGSGGHKWLGCILGVGKAGKTTVDLNHHLQAASKAFFANKANLCDRNVHVKDRLRYFDAVVSPVALFGSGHRTVHQKDLHQLDAACRKFLRAVVGPPSNLDWSRPWHEILHDWNGKVQSITLEHGMKLWSHRSLTHYWKLAMHFASVPHDRWIQRALRWTPDGRHTAGCPRHNWVTKLAAFARFLQMDEWQILAQDTTLWAPSHRGLHSILQTLKIFYSLWSLVKYCTYEVGFRRSPAPKWAAHGHAGLID